jgi:fructose-specific component phosphotransferase system IIB-like protein
MADIHRWVGVTTDAKTASNWSTNTAPGTQAIGTLTLTGNAVNGELCTFDGGAAGQYQFVTALFVGGGTANEILIGATASDTIDNLIAAINLAAGQGTTYGNGTVLNIWVTAVAGVGDTMDVTSKVLGTGGNLVTTTETMTTGSWGAGTLTGAVNTWDADDEVLFDEQNSVDCLLNVDWDGVDVAKITSKVLNSSALGSVSNPIRVACGKLLIRGEGGAYFDGTDKADTNRIDTVIVKSINGQNALTIGGLVGTRLLCVSGHMIVSGTAVSVTTANTVDRVMALTNTSLVTVNVGAVGVFLAKPVMDGGGRIINHRTVPSAADNHLVVGDGRLDQHKVIQDDMYIGGSGRVNYDPDAVAATAEVFTVGRGGVLDMSKLKFAAAVSIFVNVGGQLIEPPNEFLHTGDIIKLAEEYP